MNDNPFVSLKVFTSPADAFLVNSFIVETVNGLVVIDTQFLVSQAQKLKEKLAEYNKPLSAIIITHPHPDHFNGNIVLAEGIENLPIYATANTVDEISQSEAGKREFWKQKYGDDYPSATLLPNIIVESGNSILIDGVEFVLDELGGGESADNTVVYLPSEKILIASDLLYDKVHPWLAESRSEAWVEQIKNLKEKYKEAETVYSGHGGSGTLAAFDEQLEYIRFLQNLVQTHRQADGSVNQEQKTKIHQAVQERYSNYSLDFLIDLNIDGLAKEFAK